MKIYDERGNIVKLYMPNLLINGDFQVWQRGENFNFEPNQEIRYTADMWCVWGYQGQIYKGTNGGIVVKNSATLVQYLLEKLEVGKKYTIVISVNDLPIKFTFDGGAAYQNERFLYVVNENGYDKIKINVYNETINYVDLFEGSISYPHVKEDYATALMRCQRYLVVYNDDGVDATLSYMYADNDSLVIDMFLPVVMVAYPTIMCSNISVTNGHVSTTYNDVSLFNHRIAANHARLSFKKIVERSLLLIKILSGSILTR